MCVVYVCEGVPLHLSWGVAVHGDQRFPPKLRAHMSGDGDTEAQDGQEMDQDGHIRRHRAQPPYLAIPESSALCLVCAPIPGISQIGGPSRGESSSHQIHGVYGRVTPAPPREMCT